MDSTWTPTVRQAHGIIMHGPNCSLWDDYVEITEYIDSNRSRQPRLFVDEVEPIYQFNPLDHFSSHGSATPGEDMSVPLRVRLTGHRNQAPGLSPH